MNHALTLVYNAEAFIKILGLGDEYFLSASNKIDLLIGVVADIIFLVDTCFEQTNNSSF